MKTNVNQFVISEFNVVEPVGAEVWRPIRSLGNRRDGERDGDWFSFGSLGDLRAKTTYAAGTILFFEEYERSPGTPSRQRFFRDGSIWKEVLYHKARRGGARPRRSATFFFKEGNRSGPYTYWWKNGRVKERGWYERGVVVGKVMEYRENGTLCRVRRYKTVGRNRVRVVRHGISTEYHLDGKTKAEQGEFVHGKRTGWWNYWSAKGVPVLRELYARDRQVKELVIPPEEEQQCPSCA